MYYLEAFGPLHEFLGPMFAFAYVWEMSVLLRPAGYAVMAVSFARHLMSPILKALDSQLDPFMDYMLTRVIAMLLIAILTYVHCSSIKMTTKVQIVACAAKLLATAVIATGGIYLICNGK